MSVLTGIELFAIPDFVFASGDLGDACVAAWLVQQATDPLTLVSLGSTEASTEAPGGLPQGRLRLAGGGRLVVEFDDWAVARDWTSAHTRFLHEHAPGLEFVVVHQSGDGQDPAADLALLEHQLVEARLSRLPDAPLGALGVSAVCVRTARPATDVIDGQPASPLLLALRQPRHVEQARDRWRGFLPARMDPFAHAKGSAPDGSLCERKGWVPLRTQREVADFPFELDQLSGEPGGPASIGMLRLQGPGVGQAALRAVVERVCEGIGVVEGRPCFRAGPLAQAWPLHEDGPRFSLPLCPIILDGEELALLCHGRIARDLSKTARRAAKPARVGLALVRPRTPLRWAYELATPAAES